MEGEGCWKRERGPNSKPPERVYERQIDERGLVGAGVTPVGVAKRMESQVPGSKRAGIKVLLSRADRPANHICS